MADVFRNFGSSLLTLSVMVTAGTKAEDLRNFNDAEPPIDELAAEEGTTNKLGGLTASILLARVFHNPIKSEVFPRDTLCLDIFHSFYSSSSASIHKNIFFVKLIFFWVGLLETLF